MRSKNWFAKKSRHCRSVHFQQYASCYDCGVAQQICTRWEEIREGNKKFERIEGGGGVVRIVGSGGLVAYASKRHLGN